MPDKIIHKAHLQLYGMFLAYQLNPDQSYWEDKFAQIKQETGIYKITCFKYAIERNGLYNKFTPWIKEGSKWDLSRIVEKGKENESEEEKRKRHYPRFKQFNRIAASQGCQIEAF